MSKLSFRPRVLDAMKPMPVYMTEELTDLQDFSAINRAVPQIPSGMEKEEECEHHLQRAICAGLIIPTPEFLDVTDVDIYDTIYPSDTKMPRQLIHMQPFAMEQDIPDYDMDSEDERWVEVQSKKLDLTPLKFEEMMDRLEKASGQTVLKLQEAKILLKEDDDLIVAVYDYWLNKRLKNQYPLIPTVRTEHRPGSAANNPYLAFRRRTEKMQTRKVRKNDETSYEKMLKLRRELSRAVTLLELVKRREKTKRELLHLTLEIFEKRYQAEDFSGQLLAEVSAMKPSRPAFAPIFPNQFGLNQNWTNKVSNKDDLSPRRRSYKKRKHKGVSSPLLGRNESELPPGYDLASSDEESEDRVSPASLRPEEEEEEDVDSSDGPFAFRRKKFCNYQAPRPSFGNWPWTSKEEGGLSDKRYRYCLTSLSVPERRCIGFARRRVGRGGRVILDRASTSLDDLFSSFDFTIQDSGENGRLHFHPKTPSQSSRSSEEEDAVSFDGDVAENILLEPMCDLFSVAEPTVDKDSTAESSDPSPERLVPEIQTCDIYEQVETNASISSDEAERSWFEPEDISEMDEDIGCTRFLSVKRQNTVENRRQKRRRLRLHRRSPSPNSSTSLNTSLSSLSFLLANSGATSNLKTLYNSDLTSGTSNVCSDTVLSNGPVFSDYPMIDEAGTVPVGSTANTSYTTPMPLRGLGPPPSNNPPSCSVLTTGFQLRPSVATVSMADIKVEPDAGEVTLSSSGEDVDRVCIDQKKQQLVRKNNSVPMEVT